MAILSENEMKDLPHKFKTVPYSTFFKLWYALQKSLPESQKGTILTKIGRTIGRQFSTDGIETLEDFSTKLKEFLEQEWAITDNAKIELVKNEDGVVEKVIAKQDSCKMCFANTYYKHHDHGSPSCMFPQVMMGILSKVRRKFGFKNLRYEGVLKGGIGVCAMTWNVF